MFVREERQLTKTAVISVAKCDTCGVSTDLPEKESSLQKDNYPTDWLLVIDEGSRRSFGFCSWRCVTRYRLFEENAA